MDNLVHALIVCTGTFFSRPGHKAITFSDWQLRANIMWVSVWLSPNLCASMLFFFFSCRSSRAGSRMNSQVGSRAGSSMSGSIHQARFGSRSFIGSKSNLFSSSRKNLTSDSMRFQKPVAQVGLNTCTRWVDGKQHVYASAYTHVSSRHNLIWMGL